MRKLTIFFVFILFTFATVQAETWHVPKQFKTIQEAINASTDGDIILVAKGTYYENINFLGKRITVASHFYLKHKKHYIKKTIINGSNPADPNFGSVVTFASGEDTNSVLCGFTITGGTGTLSEIPGFPPIRQGGGILCNGSGAKVIHNRIIDNTVENAPWTMGGGFYCGPPFVPITAVLEKNHFEGNVVHGLSRVTGGGADFSASGRIEKNVFHNNTVIATVEAPAGGGLSLQSWDPALAPPNRVTVTGNIFTKNKALQPDDATFWLGGIGAGLWLIGSEGVIANNVLSHNEISGALSSYGAGVLLDYPPDDLTFKNNIVSENYYSGSGICYGGGFGIWDGNPLLINNLFIKNKGSVGGGVWLGYNFCFAKLINNTFADNEASVQGGALNTYNSHPTLMNSILWGNTAPTDPELCLESGEIDVSYCDIAGDWPGEGNINMKPKMLGKTYLLHRFSPCVDAGHPDEMYFDPESPWRLGYARIPARGTVHNDMGAFGGPGAVDWRMPFIKSNSENAFAAKTDIKSSCYPNPFNPITTIEITLPHSARVGLKIFNVLGQQIVSLCDTPLNEGTHHFTWDATTIASGVYFYRLEVNGNVLEMNKLILLK